MFKRKLKIVEMNRSGHIVKTVMDIDFMDTSQAYRLRRSTNLRKKYPEGEQYVWQWSD